MAADENEAYMIASLLVKNNINSGINYVVHTKIQKLIADTLTADPVKHGHWIWTRYYTWHCSECGGLIATPGYMPTKDELPKRYRFCSQCGVKMDEDTTNETD